MEGIVSSSDVASERCEGSLVLLKATNRFLCDSRPLPISMFTYITSGWGLGLGICSYVMMGLGSIHA
jgi:hypothetical protein